MDREINYYGTGKEEAAKESSYLQRAVKMPPRTGLHIAIFAAIIATVLAAICGYYAFTSNSNDHTQGSSIRTLHR